MFQNIRKAAIFIICCLLWSNAVYSRCHHIMKEHLEQCLPVSCNDDYNDRFYIKRTVIGSIKDGHCKYTESYKNYAIYFECNFSNAIMKKIIQELPLESGPWIYKYDNACQPIFAHNTWHENKKDTEILFNNKINKNLQEILQELNIKSQQYKNLNFFSDQKEINEKRNFIYLYDIEDFKNRDMLQDNIKKNLEDLKFFINKNIASNKGLDVVSNIKLDIVTKYLEIIKYLYSSMITVNSIIYFNNSYAIHVNDKNLASTDNQYNDFHLEVFDRGKVTFSWNTKYFDELFMLFREHLVNINNNALQHSQFPEIVFNLQKRLIYITLDANNTFNPLYMSIEKGGNKTQMTEKNFTIRDIFGDDMATNTENKKIILATNLINSIDFDFYNSGSQKYFFKDSFIKTFYNLLVNNQ